MVIIVELLFNCRYCQDSCCYPGLLLEQSSLCPLHISRSDAPIVPRCCRLGQCEWSPDTESAVGASSGGHREVIGQY